MSSWSLVFMSVLLSYRDDWIWDEPEGVALIR
jgi:hypothetical protein